MPTETMRCRIVEMFCPKGIAERLCPKEVAASGKCWKCRVAIPFTVPRRGYSNGSGMCPTCGVKYTMLSNYGAVTIFPPKIFEEYAVELFDRALTSMTAGEARDILQKIGER